jgi:hypothetical protein
VAIGTCSHAARLQSKRVCASADRGSVDGDNFEGAT